MASRVAGAFVLALAVGCAASAPVETRLPQGAVLVAAVGDGQALATDGRVVYLADGAEATVRTFTPSGVSGALAAGPVYGGRGAGAAGALLAPRGLDVGTGLLVLVADAGRGEVARFTTRGEQAAPLVVPDLDPTAGVRERIERAAPRGRPVAVASRAGVVYVADAGRSHVLRYADDRLEAVLGGPADREAALSRPTSLALGADGTLYVADGGRVQPFGPLGPPRPALPLGLDAASVAVADGRLVVAGSADGTAALARGPVDGPLVTTHLDLGEPLRGAVFWAGGVLVLTPTRLVWLAP